MEKIYDILSNICSCKKISGQVLKKSSKVDGNKKESGQGSALGKVKAEYWEGINREVDYKQINADFS